MRHRLQLTTMSIVAVVLLLFSVPLAIAAKRFYESQAIVSLDRRVEESATEVSVPLSAPRLRDEFGKPRIARPSLPVGAAAKVTCWAPDRVDEWFPHG